MFAGDDGTVPQPQVSGAGAEAVPVAARPERGVHRRHQLLLPHPPDCQLLPGTPAAIVV